MKAGWLTFIKWIARHISDHMRQAYRRKQHGLNSKIRVIEDFPKKGISFKDITTLLKDKEAHHYTIDTMVDICRKIGADVVVGPEARGFVLGAPVAYGLNTGFVLAKMKAARRDGQP